jgi:cytochrome c oxidase subunit 4
MATTAPLPGDSSEATRTSVHIEPREVLAVFGGLLIILLIEVALVRSAGLPRGTVRLTLLGLAVTKAILIGFFFMHLKQETRVLRLTVLGPLAVLPVYAVVLMADAAWRFLR